MDRVGQAPERVVITGVAITCALGDGAESVWKAIQDGQSGIKLTSRLDVSMLSCRYSGEIVEMPAVPTDAVHHAGWRRPTGRIDRATRLALAAAHEAIGAAGLALPGSLDPYRVGVALGTSVGGLDEGERFHWELLEHGVDATHRGRLLVYPLYTSADAISIALGVKGPKVVISNACAAGANSIGYAADTIRSGRADAMVAGGVDVLDILSLAGFDSLKALDPEPCAPYSRSTGLNIGEGAAILVLEAESVARDRGATVLGYLRGYALTSDAHHATAPDPAGSGARRAMLGALTEAGLEPSDVDYINGHGTGTPANDSAETKAVDTLFGTGRPPMSSTKSQIGHTLGAAGAIEAAVSVLALRDAVLPPTVNVADPAALTRDVVPNMSRPAEPSVVVSNSFAFGGNNCALVLGRDPGPSEPSPDRRVVLTGAGVVSPLGVGRDEFLTAIRAGTVAIGPGGGTDTALSRTHLTAEIAEAAYRKHVDPAYARRLDQLGRLVLAATRLGVRDAGYPITRATSERIGMVFGTFTGPMETVGQLTRTIGTVGPHRVNPRLFPNSVMNAAAGHACLSLQLRGPLSTLATGCASGLAGLGYAADLIRRGAADAMIAVSADELTPLLHLGFDRLGLLADDEVRLYDRNPSGAALGPGAVALVLESADSARARGATILAEVAGHATTSDAYRVAGNDPSGQAWAESFRRAIADARLSPAEIGTVYGDARGTAVLDTAEARAVASVWQPGRARLANLNAQAGHLHATTSLLSAVCAAETVRTGWAPPIPSIVDPLPAVAGHLDWAGAEDDRPCLVTAANWGGTYVSAVLRRWEDA